MSGEGGEGTEKNQSSGNGAGDDVPVFVPEPFKLPERSTRGKRMAELIGDELEEDEEFWNDERWNEASDDDDFVESDEDEGESDDADSDFDAPEVEDEAAVSEDVVIAEEKYQAKQERKQRGGYVDPALKRRREEKQRAKEEKKKGKDGSAETTEEDAADAERRKKERQLARKMKREEAQKQRLAALKEGKVSSGLERRSLRQSTVNRSLEDEQKRRERDAEVERKRSARHKRAEEPARPMTQEEKMAEAEKTEEKNKRELEELLAIFQAQKSRAHRIEREYGVGPVTVLSRLVPNSSSSPSSRVEVTTITYKNDTDMPLYHATEVVEPPYPKEHICAVTGKPAHYRDPLTGYWYADAQAFRVLRSNITKTTESVST